MNCRHACYSANFAGVIKHIVLVLYLGAGLCLIDAHAGARLYWLDSDEVEKTDEWQRGIGRLTHASCWPPDRKPYLDLVEADLGAALSRLVVSVGAVPVQPTTGSSQSSAPYLTRRARLRLGMTETQFAVMFDVDVITVSRWERGKLRSHPGACKRIRQIAGAAYDGVRASPVAKYVVHRNDLLHPSLISQGLERILKRYGIDAKEAFLGYNLRERVYRSAQYPLSGMHALEMIEADPRWRDGSAVYAEAHCISVLFGHAWRTPAL
jgi:transcriptional regulator with XRE-family HTH domain